MKDTSCGENCPFVKQGFCSHERECPNFIETWWYESEGSQPVKISDCSPKRMLLQQQLLQARFEHMQQALEQSRNQFDQLCGYLRTVVQATQLIVNQSLQEVKNENITPTLIDNHSDK